MKIGMHVILYMLTAWLQMDPYLNVFLAGVARPPQLLKGFECAVRYTHMYLACI